MPAPMQLPLPTPEVVERLINGERNCMIDWLQAMARLPGNPFDIAIEPFGHATALVCGRIPAQIFNRVIGLTVEDREHIPAILDLYAKHGAEPLFDLNPYAIPPFWIQPNITPLLHAHGLYQGAWHQILYGLPTSNIPELPSNLSVRVVTPDDADTFVAVYEEVWGDGTAVRVLIEQPQFHCYLAYVDNVPAGLGILHVANGLGSMANGLTIPSLRGQGCQTALLYRRLHDAALAGCDLMVSQCRPGGTSQNNQLRVGFRIAGSKAWWIPAPEMA
jgi:hypothetical protein